MPGTECLRQLNRLRTLANLAEGERLAPEQLAQRLFGQGCVRDDFVSLPTEAELVRVGTSFRVFVRAKLAPGARARAVARCIAEWMLRDEPKSDDRGQIIQSLTQAILDDAPCASSAA